MIIIIILIQGFELKGILNIWEVVATQSFTLKRRKLCWNRVDVLRLISRCIECHRTLEKKDSGCVAKTAVSLFTLERRYR